jgi:protein-S-isoprenylcysteine O-methyltransferase Ste14
MKDEAPLTPGRLILAATRIWLPLAIAVAGVVLIVLGHASLSNQAGGRALEAASGVGLLIVAIIVWMVNWMFRMSVQSNRDREVEEEAREYFDRHGYWPGEGPQ